MAQKITTNIVDVEQAVLSDIKDIWLDGKFNYVDIGAYDGSFALKVANCGLPVREMHLIEAEPKAYTELCNIFKEKTLAYCYKTAAGEKTKEIILRRAKTMTSAMPGNKQLSNRDICVNCNRLDEILSGRVREGITLMKIDVEGMELDVIEGAHQLLSDGNTSMIYIEVGFNPPHSTKGVAAKGTYQQTSFLDVYNSLDSLGFKLCRFYEQKNNWIQDSPVLRRANVLFLHKEFIKTHPFSLAGRLNKMQEELNTLRNIVENTTLKSNMMSQSDMIKKMNQIETELKSLKRLNLSEKSAQS